jgi:hypothetical protein
MRGLLTFGLFVSLLAAFWLLLVGEEEKPSPAALAVDWVKRWAIGFMGGGGREERLALAGWTPAEAARTGMIAGAGLAAIGGLLAFLLCRPLVPFLVCGLFLAGVLVARYAADNEYRRWQAALVDGMPDLVNFLPAFLEVTGITPKEALSRTVRFLSGPLKAEMERVLDPIERRGGVDEAFEEFRKRANHPLADAVSTRLAAAWNVTVTPDMFADLADQVRDAVELAAARATAAKGGLLALVCVLGMAGMALVFGWPGVQYLLTRLGEGFM